jgi:CheY-like chemotaxis protein
VTAHSAITILIVDDDPPIRRFLQALLEGEGYLTCLAANGQEALERVLVGDYDVVLMDVQMPVMDGLAATRAIRAAERGTGRRVRVVALTAHAGDENLGVCLSAGMDDYLAKPFKTEDLLAKIEGRVGGSEGMRPSAGG